MHTSKYENRVFVTSDTHGCNKELLHVLKLAEFDYQNDTLIHLGDVCDRGPDSFGVVSTLLMIKNLIAIRGNHDDFMREFIRTGEHPCLNMNGVYKTVLSYAQSGNIPYEELYIHQVGYNTIDTNFQPEHMPADHIQFYLNQRSYYVDDQNRCFVHAGYNRDFPIEAQNEDMLMWDGTILKQALCANKGDKFKDVNKFKRTFVGHQPTTKWKKKGKVITKPIYAAHIVDVDTGVVFGDGKISLLDITDDDNHILYQTGLL